MCLCGVCRLHLAARQVTANVKVTGDLSAIQDIVDLLPGQVVGRRRCACVQKRPRTACFAAGCISACTVGAGIAALLLCFVLPALAGESSFGGPSSAYRPDAPPWSNFTATSTSVSLSWGVKTAIAKDGKCKDGRCECLDRPSEHFPTPEWRATPCPYVRAVLPPAHIRAVLPPARNGCSARQSHGRGRN